MNSTYTIKPFLLILSLGWLAIYLSGCMTLSQKEYLAAHPELTPLQIEQVKKQQVRPGQSMEMVKAMLGAPYQQTAPGSSQDALFYWTQNPAANHTPTYTPPVDEKTAALNHTLTRTLDIAEEALRDQRGKLRIIYFVNGRVSHEEIRANVFPEDIHAIH